MGKKKTVIRDRTPRPRFRCPKCGQVWVSDHEMICIICVTAVGEPLNAGAEKLICKLREGKAINHLSCDGT